MAKVWSAFFVLVGVLGCGISDAKASNLYSRRTLICESRDISLVPEQHRLNYALSIEVSTFNPRQRPFLTFFKDGSLVGMSDAQNTKIENIGEDGNCDIRVLHKFGDPEVEMEFVIKRADQVERNVFANMTIRPNSEWIRKKTEVTLICELDRTIVNKYCRR